MKKYWLHIFCLLGLAITAGAQQERQYSFTHYGVSSGLASNEATASLQDEQGFIWVGTNRGLQRFDGQRYLNFIHQKDDPTSIPNNYIVQLLLDKKKNLWVLTGDGKAGIFNTKTFRYEEIPVRVKDKNILFADRVLTMDEEGHLYIIYAHLAFLTWSETHREFSSAHNFIPLPPDWQTSWCVQQQGTKKYWIAGPKGLAVYDAQAKQLSYKGHNVAKEAIIDSLGDVQGATRIMIDKQERLWFDAWLGAACLYAFDLKKKEVILNKYSFVPIIDGYHELRGLLQQKDGTIWIKGLNVFARYIEKERKFQQVYNGYQNEQSIDYDRVNDIFEDRDRNIWVCTNNNGLYSFNPAEQFFSNIRHINRSTRLPGKGAMMSFILTKQRTLLAGAWGDGLYRFDSNYRMLPLNIRGIDEKGTPWVWSMCLSPDSSTIWMGAQPGIYALNQATQTVTGHNPPIMKNRTVRQVAADRFGNLWMGTQSLGVFKWTAANGQKRFDNGVEAYNAIPVNQILKIFVCSKGFVWVGTSNFGVYVIDPVTDKIVFHLSTTEPPERRLLGDWAPGITQYDDSTIVIAAKGVHLFNTKRGKITKTIQLPQSSTGNLAAVEKDKNGYIWLSLSDGLFRLNPRNEIFVHFDRMDGMMNDHFVTAASYKLPSGRLVFGADNQLILFDPLKVMLNDPAPNIVITGFKLRNKPLLVDSLIKNDQVTLGPEENSITVEFSGLGYGRAYIIKYMLQGLDKDWIVADNNNQAVYSYLPAGNYTFLVKAEDAEGNPSKNITRLVMKIKPPFWRTWWFLGLAVFATVGLFYWIDKQRTQKIRATESIRTRIATSLTEDMSNSLSSINISSELAKNKIDTDTARTKEYIAQISDASNRMVQAMYDMVWSINPGNDNLPDTIARMREFAAEIENSYDVTVVFDIEQQVMKLKLDMEYRYELLGIFKEAVTNAARHSLAKHIQLSLRLRNNKLIMLVEDDGKGFDLETGVLGRGISDMRRRASAIDASFYIESNVNTGSIVKLEMSV
ncbi:ligand-binding sensor domain-containing protein [Terrimonas alba]|uniref:ligand-binding sensor domain-containing protein n=1 Tax=Terrimonas alba TaxID=3349636 RepID=UPI0035F4B0F4